MASVGTYQVSCFEQQLDALVVHDVAVLDAVRAEPDRVLHRIGVGRVRHHLELALAADREGRFAARPSSRNECRVAVPRRPHDAAREVELDVVDAVLDLLADRLDEAVGAVALERVTRGQEVAAGGREEMAAGEQARARRTGPESNARFQATSMKLCVPAQRKPTMPDSVSAAISRWPNSVTWSASGISASDR